MKHSFLLVWLFSYLVLEARASLLPQLLFEPEKFVSFLMSWTFHGIIYLWCSTVIKQLRNVAFNRRPIQGLRTWQRTRLCVWKQWNTLWCNYRHHPDYVFQITKGINCLVYPMKVKYAVEFHWKNKDWCILHRATFEGLTSASWKVKDYGKVSGLLQWFNSKQDTWSSLNRVIGNRCIKSFDKRFASSSKTCFSLWGFAH